MAFLNSANFFCCVSCFRGANFRVYDILPNINKKGTIRLVMNLNKKGRFGRVYKKGTILVEEKYNQITAIRAYRYFSRRRRFIFPIYSLISSRWEGTFSPQISVGILLFLLFSIITRLVETIVVR